MPHQPAVGTIWVHLKRGTRYEIHGTGRIVGESPLMDEQRILLNQDEDGIWKIKGIGDGIVANLQSDSPMVPGDDGLVIYKEVDAWRWWARPLAEFMDGRFAAEESDA